MSYLWPWAWGLLALVLPLIALYLVKTRVPRRVIPTLLFWTAIKPRLIQQPFWRKLRRWLSLALQLLFLLLLVLALTQPQPSKDSLRPKATVFVLDPSANMRARDVSPSRWQKAVDLLLSRINGMRHFDESAIILATDPPRILSGWTHSQRQLKSALNNLAPSLRAEDVRPALSVATNLARSREDARIVFLSDGVLENPLEAKTFGTWSRVGGESVNTGITLFSARRSAVAPGDFQISAEVKSNAKETINAQLELRRDGQLVDVQNLSLAPGQNWPKTWAQQGNEGAVFSATLTGLKRDDLSEDNQAEIKVLPLHSLSILLVSPSNAFLEAALGSLGQVEWKRVDPGQETPADLASSDLVIYYRCAPSGSDRAKAMLLIAPPGEGFWGRSEGELPSPLISDWQKESTPLRYISLDQLRLNRADHFAPGQGATVFAESFGQPLIFGDWEGTSRWLVLAFDLEQSDFVLRAAFPVFLGNITQSLRSTEDVSKALLPGDTATLLVTNLNPGDTIPEKSPEAWAAFWGLHPIWWWAIAAGVVWLLLEALLYARRVTE